MSHCHISNHSSDALTETKSRFYLLTAIVLLLKATFSKTFTRKHLLHKTVTTPWYFNSYVWYIRLKCAKYHLKRYDTISWRSVLDKSLLPSANVWPLCYNVLYRIMQLIVQVIGHFQIIKNPLVTFYYFRYIFALSVCFVVSSYDYYTVTFSAGICQIIYTFKRKQCLD